MPKTGGNIKVGAFLSQSRYWLLLQALAWLEKLGICLQISNKLHNNVFAL